MTESFDADWLAQREPFDAAARSTQLAVRLVALLPTRPRLLDLGTGTFSMFRWLAPIIGRAQAWTLADADASLIETGFLHTKSWAARRGSTVTWPGKAMLVHAPLGAWRLEALTIDLAAAPGRLKTIRCDAIVCSALLDLVSAAWLHRMSAALRVPLLATLSVDGRDVWQPCHPLDRLVLRGFRRHQGRDKGLGPALGIQAPGFLLRKLHGFRTASAPSDWRIGRRDLRMAQDVIHAYTDAAVAACPARAGSIEAWRHARLRQAADARLAIRIGHRDILAIPGEESAP